VSIQSSHKIVPIERMRFRLTFLVVLSVGLVFASIAPPLEAQESALLAAIHDLAAKPEQLPATRARFIAALREWDREIAALKTGADTFQRHVELGLVYRRRGQLPEALAHFEAAAALRPNASDVQLLRARTLDAAGRPTEAGRAYHAAWARDDANPLKAYLALRRAQGLDDAASARAARALRDALGRILAGTVRPSPQLFVPLDLFPDAMAGTPLTGEGRMDRVFSLLADSRLDDAAAALEAVGPAAPGPDGSSLRIERAGTHERGGRLTDARREYMAAVEGALAGRYALYVGIGRLAQVEGDADAAVDAYENAVRLNPNDPALRREFGAALVAAGRFDDAFAEFVVALLIAPDDAEVLAAVGQMFLDTDRAQEAIAPLRRALAVKADRYETHYALATALARAGRPDDAAREFAEFDRLSRQATQNRRRVVAGQP
jgi:tetratricopeptide (TPR) repeat protein